MRKFPPRAAVLTSVFFVSILLMTPYFEDGGSTTDSAASAASSRSYEREAANAGTHLEPVHTDPPEHNGTKLVRDEAVSIRKEGNGHNARNSHPDATYLETVPKDKREEPASAYHHRQSGRIVGGQGDVDSHQHHGQPAGDGAKEESNDDDSEVRTRPSPSTGIRTTNSSAGDSLQRTKIQRSGNRTWGSHPLPSASEFQAEAGTHWVTFFHDQAVAAVLVTENATILDCIVQEVIKKWEQRKSLQYLGKMMPLEHLELPLMVHLSSLCGVLNTPPPTTQQPTGPINVWTHGLSVLQGILPGTMWCGRSDTAASYRQLGPRAALDSCCRTHDHCPTKLLPMTTGYGLTNLSLKTRSHCLCELEFYRCLKAVQSDPLAVTVGQVYFNFLQLECLSPVPAADRSREGHAQSGSYSAPSAGSGDAHTAPTPSISHPIPPMVCSRRDWNGGCRKWLPNPQATVTRYHFIPSTLTY